ncbi:MAG TPA: hypothetical protein PLG79_03180 [Spirochaetales bacterium]|nr:hypothetical protein [Spirochaetales bacterium]
MNRLLGFVLMGVLFLGTEPGGNSYLMAQPYTGIFSQAVWEAAKNLPLQYAALHAGEYPLALFHDLDGDGLEDIFLLSVKKTDDQTETSVTVLSEYSRVFEASAVQTFFFHAFLRRHSSSSLVKTLELGPKRALGSFKLFEIQHTARIPFGIEITFPNTIGLERDWVLISSSSRYELFVFQEQHNVKSYTRDINGDGTLDLVLFENMFEDSLGYETYATWYRWEGSTYKRYRSVNILRNLKTFLGTIKQYILMKNWDALFQYALQPQDAAYAKAAGPTTALPRIFRSPPPPLYPVSGGEPSSIGLEVLERRFTDLVFPEILENPFNLREDGPESFVLTFRLSVEGENYLVSTRVSMYKNPFQGKLFHLVLQ